MKRPAYPSLLLFLAVVLAGGTCVAASGPAPLPAEDREARELIRTQITPEYMEDVYLQVAQAVSVKFQASVQPTLGRPITENEKERLLLFWHRKTKELMPYSVLEGLLAPVVTKHLTPAEIRELIAFYRTPTGRKIVTLMPVFMRESQAAGEEMGKKLADREWVQATVEELRGQFPQWFPAEGAGEPGKGAAGSPADEEEDGGE